jgi:stage V sporulation protein D (sporulation-specific penicillin-binding protein)
MNVVKGIIAAFTCVLVFFIAWYSIINREYWLNLATDQQMADVVIPAKRGTIYDANMEEIVKSNTAWRLVIRTTGSSYDTMTDAQKIKVDGVLHPRYQDAVVKKIADVCELTEEYINSRLSIRGMEVNIKGKYNKLQKDEINTFITELNNGIRAENEQISLYNASLSKDQKETMSKLTLPLVQGISWSEDTVRYYKYGSLGSTILGFTNDGNEASMGLEQQYNNELSGVDGRSVTAKAARNSAVMPYEYTQLVDPIAGNNIVTTIDVTVQQYLEKYLSKAVKDNDIRNRACGIIMNVNTGAILAMATMPDFDPSDYLTIKDTSLKTKTDLAVSKEPDSDKKNEILNSARQSQWNNKLITDTYEPGSVFKPITMASALEEGLTNVGDTFYCRGSKIVAGRAIKCHRAGGHGSENLTQGMMNSCNPVFMTLAERLGASKFYKYFTAFGFTEKTGIDLPGEVKGMWHTEAALGSYAGNLAVSSFGQSFTITPIQMATAISAVANGGYLVTPHLVSSIVDGENNIIKKIDTVVKRQVISEDTSKKINAMLEETVSNGTAKNGYIKGYRLGGKTGTSEKLRKTQETGVKEYIASYCGVAPCDNPEIIMLVILDEPKGASHAGGATAAPVVRNVLSEVLPYLGVETIYSTEDAELLDTLAPGVEGRTLDEAKTTLTAKGLKYRVVGSGDTVISQIPKGGQSVPKGSTVVICTSEDSVPKSTVPDLRGMSPSAANKALTKANLNIRYAGSGYDSTLGVVVGQSIEKGTKVEQGTVVTVEFIQSGSTD